MNSLKPLVTLAVLGAVGYVVYTQLNQKPPTPPPGATAWETAPTVQLPGQGSADASLPGPRWGTVGGAAPSSAQSSTPTFPPSASISAPTAPAIDTPVEAAPAFGRVEPVSAAPAANDRMISYDRDAERGLPPAASTNRSSPPLEAPDAYGSTSRASDQAANEFQKDWQTAQADLDAGRLKEALVILSRWYDHPQLTTSEQQQLTELLDQLAGTVIYSVQPLLDPPHVVRAGERMEDLEREYNVPWQLLAKINGIDDPASLVEGEKVKVIRGPFSALLSLERRQLTLMLDGMYAGRFAVGLGRDDPPREGNFTVREKVANPVYHGRDRTIDAEDPQNPLGERWIGLEGNVGIHGVGPLADIGSVNQPGSVSLGGRDVEDVFDILSVGSKVMIVR